MSHTLGMKYQGQKKIIIMTIIINKHDDIYDAVIVAPGPLQKFTPVHLMNAD